MSLLNNNNSSIVVGDNNKSFDVFLGGSCGSTVWRSEIVKLIFLIIQTFKVIPYLKKRGITYYDPQRPIWSDNMIQEEFQAKEVKNI